MSDPTFPIVVPDDQKQEQGAIDLLPIFDTQRGPNRGRVEFTEQGDTKPADLYDPPLIREQT